MIEEKCSSVACRGPPIIEIVAWNGITLDTHMFLCRKHWLEKVEEDSNSPHNSKTRVIKFMQDLRTYL